MLLFKSAFHFDNPFNVVFLCGSSYSADESDKRNVLKSFLLKKKDCQVIILEENFQFKKTNKQYLAYDDIFLSNLAEIETLAALYADRIIIIHESISTAAEIGLFAGNRVLLPKICLIVPDAISIEENKVSPFLKLAFMNYEEKSKNLHRIIYYPAVDIFRYSCFKSDYHTTFPKNNIGSYLGKKILNFLNGSKAIDEVRFKRVSYGKTLIDPRTISYSINADTKIIKVSLSPEALRIQLLAMFGTNVYRRELRKEKLLREHVSYIDEQYRLLLLNTICDLEGIPTGEQQIKIELRNAGNCNFRQATGLFIYMMQAVNMIGLERLSTDAMDNQIKFRLCEEMKPCVKELKEYIFKKGTTSFGEIMS